MTYPKIKLVGWYNHQSDWQCRAKLPRRPPVLVELRPNIFISLGQNNSEYPQKVSSAVLCWCCVLQLGHTTEEAARAVEAGKGSLALHYSLLTTHYLQQTSNNKTRPASSPQLSWLSGLSKSHHFIQDLWLHSTGLDPTLLLCFDSQSARWTVKHLYVGLREVKSGPQHGQL